MEMITDNKLNDLSDSAKMAEQNTQAFMQPEVPKEKGKRGRKPYTEEEKKQKAVEQAQKAKMSQSGSTAGQPSPQSQPTQGMGIQSKEIAKPIVQLISSSAVSYVGDPRASMTPDEMDNIAGAMGLLIDKYAPTILNQYGAEAMLLMAMGSYSMRIMAMKKVLEMERINNQIPPEPRMRQDEPIKTDN